MVQRRTKRGNMIDMDALMLKNEEELALGNMKVNARGDKIGPGGKIIKSKEEAGREYYDSNPKAVVKTVSIKDNVDAGVTEAKAQPTTSNTVTKVKKTTVKKTKEIELPNGDIEIEEVEE